MYIKKTMMWLLLMEQTDGVEIKLGRKRREYRLPEIPDFGLDAYCTENNTVKEFCGCFCHANN